jgi:hypothetical protein
VTVATFEVWLCNAKGNPIGLIENAVEFTYTHATHAAGFFSLALPGTFPRQQLNVTRRVLFFRKPPGGSPALDFVGFVRRPGTNTGSEGAKTRTLSGYGPNWLVSGRVVLAAAGSPEAAKTGSADDLMKEIATEQMGASAPAARQYPSAYFAVQPSSGSGPILTKAFAYQNALDVARELSEAARQAGIETFFHVLPLGVNQFLFVTSIAQLGRDLRRSGLVFGIEQGNLKNAHLDEDWSDEANVGYGLGKGEGALRDVQTAEEPVRSGLTWYGRREVARDARTQDSAGALAAAQAAIVAARPVAAFGGDILSTAGALYGVDWRFGDRVDVTYDGRTFAALVRAVTVTVNQNGAETVGARLEAYL